MNKIIKQELLKSGIQFNDDDTHIIINKRSELDPKFTKENQCYIIQYSGDTYKVEVLNKNDEGVLVNGILVRDGKDSYLENIYKRLAYNEFKVVSKI